ncbi:thioester-containing protein 1 allele R1-like [Chironomus tepperi]|uniref:thioester-containing protein 1 allele R1-like n=1 Tax=Chironomus tepperi TaxID=113505 RepID=UPI00391FC175
MMYSALIFLLFLSANAVDSSDEFTSIWTPNVMQSGKDYEISLLSENLDKRTEISFQICNLYVTTGLASDKLQILRFQPNSQVFGSKNNKIDITLHRRVPISNGTRQMCMTQTIKDVKTSKKSFKTLIQTDKPVYEPGSEIKYRIIVIDSRLGPYDVKSIKIQLLDPEGRIVNEINEKLDNFDGVYTGQFKLGNKTPLGVWRITAVIDEHHKLIKSKEFGVKIYKRPKITAFVTTKDDHLLTTSILKLSIYAKNIAGYFVSGDAQLTITCTTTGQVILSESFTNITGIHTVQYKAHEDLKANTTTKLDYTATVVFTDPESGISANKSTKFTVHADNSPKIEANHPKRFLPGFPFGIKVSIYDWTEKLIESTAERVVIRLICRLQNGEIRTDVYDSDIKRGVVIVNALIPEDAEELTVKIQYLWVKYEKEIEKRSFVVGINKIAVDYMPKFPNYGDVINVHIRGDSEINQLIGIVMSRHGNIKSHQIYCNYRINCKFNFTIKEDMMPEAKVVVYYLKDRINMYHGETTITTAEMSRNTLDIDVHSSTSRRQIETKINTPGSKVYFYGYDKRLTKLYQKNEVNREGLASILDDFDGSNKVTVLNMGKRNWHDCTDQELRRINLGRHVIGYDYPPHPFEDDDEVVCHEDNTDDEPVTFEESESMKLDDIEDDFRYPSIFKDIEGSYGTLTKALSAPYPRNSWVISSFSLSSKHQGPYHWSTYNKLAIGHRKEVTFDNQFYTQILYPKVIKFDEIAQIDVLVYNLVDSYEAIDVVIRVSAYHSDKNVKFYDSKCSLMSNSETSLTRSINVKYNSPQKLSFFIQSPGNASNVEGKAKIRIDATGAVKSSRFMDKKLIALQIEPVGVKRVEFIAANSSAKHENDADDVETRQVVTEVTSKANTHKIGIAGDFDKNLYDTYSLIHQTYQLKEKVENFRQLRPNNTKSSTEELNELYQTILAQRTENWHYKNTSGYTAIFIDTIASAMEIGALPKDTAMIEKEFDVLKASQNENGSFSNFGYYPEFQSDPTSVEYFQTAFILIPFLKFRGFIAKNYDDVIDKGFKFLNEGSRNLELLDRQALAVAAHVYVLNNDNDQAQKLLNEIQQSSDSQKCFKYSANATTVDGTGPCTTRKAVESFTAVEHQNSKFNVTLTTLPGLIQNERIVRVCATYQHQENSTESQTLFSVVYDVEMPSGYMYEEIVNYDTNMDIKFPATKSRHVLIYFNEFTQGTSYCVDIKAKKLHNVINIQNAGVKVFDYNDHDNVSILFYTFSSDDCK